MSLEEFRQRAEAAEGRIKELEKKLSLISIEEAKQPETPPKPKAKPAPKKKPAKKDEEEAKIPFIKIEDEAVVIRERGCDAVMNVTMCNGEANPPFISARGIKYLQANYTPSDLDIFVDSYAKCGTTLCIHLVFQALKLAGKEVAGASHEDMADPWRAVPWIEVDVSQQLAKTGATKEFDALVAKSNQDKVPRIWKTHAPWVNMPIKSLTKDTRIIHITRNPKDVVCSYFNFFRKEPLVKYEGDFDTLFDWFCDGSVVHSSFFDFELAWWRAMKENPQQILWVTFEDILRKPQSEIKRICEFLGNISLTPEQLDTVAKEISFDNMKQMANKKADQKGGGSILMNKGIIGRWRTKLSEEQSARMDRIVSARFAGTGIKFDFGDDYQS